ncbi:CoA-transferase family III [Daldinia bambusicola]|nr:CoA-transferase family III [Daldinia bambusicola]
MNPDPTLTALGLPLDGEETTHTTHTTPCSTSRRSTSSWARSSAMRARQRGHPRSASPAGMAKQAGRSVSTRRSKTPTPRSPRPCGPTTLAEMGASVMRATSPRITDLSRLHQDLNWGDGADPGGRCGRRRIPTRCDGEAWFRTPAILDLVNDRSRVHRSGWQQISDACYGVSLSYGRAMGNDEAVTPVFRIQVTGNTGLCGSTAVLDALVRRAEHGGSYGIDVALNYYSKWLVRSVGTYDEETWNEAWKRHGSPVFRYYHAMQHLLPAMLKLLYQRDSQVLFNPALFRVQETKSIAATFVQVKPVAQFADGAVDLGYHIGTRGNGVDEPLWPGDLTVEVITGKY